MDETTNALDAAANCCLASNIVAGDESERNRHVFLSTVADTQILSSLGFQCRKASGLIELSGKDVRGFLHRTKEEPNLRFTLVAVDMTNPSATIPTSLRPILKRLAEVKEVYRIPPEHEIKVWMPNSTDLRRLRAAPKYKDRKLLQGVSKGTPTVAIDVRNLGPKLSESLINNPLVFNKRVSLVRRKEL